MKLTHWTNFWRTIYNPALCVRGLILNLSKKTILIPSNVKKERKKKKKKKFSRSVTHQLFVPAFIFFIRLVGAILGAENASSLAQGPLPRFDAKNIRVN